jgi:energy-coupling factor transport system ATP-binding protein
VIDLHSVRYRYPGEARDWDLRGIDLTIRPGEYVFVCGASGSGKSTLAYLLNGLVPHFFGGVLEGEVEVCGIRTRAADLPELFPHVGLVLQNADAHLFNGNVESEIAFGLESLGLPPGEISRRIEHVTETLRLEHLLPRSPMTLSNGEKRLVGIASVLGMDPPIVVLDEPFAHLDWDGAAAIREALWRVHQSGKTVLVVEHRGDGFLQDATRGVVLDRGGVAFDGPSRDLPAAMAQWRLTPRYPARPRREAKDAGTAIAVHDLSFRRDGRWLLNGVSFQVGRGETVAIVGKNGAGKTTLIQNLNGLLRPTRGDVTVLGKSTRGTDPSRLAPVLGLSFQNPNDQFFKFRVRDELLVGPMALGRDGRDDLASLCDLFRLDALLDRSPFRLSEGEKKRVALASILAAGPRILVLDEPTTGQDGQTRQALAELLKGLEDQGLTILIVSHDLEFARAVADRWILLEQGAVMADGPPEDILGRYSLARTGVSRGEPEAEMSMAVNR